MNNQEFEVKFVIEKVMTISAKNESEAKKQAMNELKKQFGDTIEFHVRDSHTSVFNMTEHKKWMQCIRQEVKDGVYEIIDGMAEEHVECWAERYTGKSKDDIEFDLGVNYDMCSEIDSIEDCLKQVLKDDSLVLNEEEREYVEEKFVEAVLDSF